MRSVVVGVLGLLLGCTDDEAGPTPVIDRVEPQAICPTAENDQVLVRVSGTGFVVDDDHTVDSIVELWRGSALDVRKVALLEPDLEGIGMTLVFRNGEAAPANSEAPHTYELHVVNPDAQTAVFEGFTVHSSFGFGTVTPITAAASGGSVTVNLAGAGFYAPMTAILETQVRTFATEVVVSSVNTAQATFDLAGIPPGTYGVTMRNAGGCTRTIVSTLTVTP